MHKPTKKKRPFLGRILIAGATIIIRSKKDYDRKKEKRVDADIDNDEKFMYRGT